jgi:hypothetical protein
MVVFAMLLIGLGVFMHLKLFVLSASSVALWIAPLAALDKTLDIHKALQGLSLTAAIACAVTAATSPSNKLSKMKSSDES